jgi:hypothetical protein
MTLLSACSPRPSLTPVVTAEVGVRLPAVRFVEVAQQMGITYRWTIEHKPLRINEANRAGCAFLDYDNDGWQDLLFVGPQGLALYRNDHGRRFIDVTAQSGLSSIHGYWMGCAIGDVDQDGFLDVLITGYKCTAFLRNAGGKKFVDATRAAGFQPIHNRWQLSAGFMDLDGSGALSAVITNYVDFGPHDKQYCEPAPGVISGCSPQGYQREYPQIFRNDGSGHFRDATAESGLAPLHGNAMTVAFADACGSGRMDIYIGNDGKKAELFRNLGGFRFKNIGQESGVADYMNHAIAAMGADWGDYNRDGRPDLAVSAFSDEAYSVCRNEGNGLFTYVSEEAGISGATFRALAFGTKWIDVDNDGWLDLAFANGHVYDNAERVNAAYTFRQPLMIFHNIASKTGREFDDVAPQMAGIGDRPIVGRGLASGDFDNDGKLDLVVADLDGAPLLLHNESSVNNHWVTFDLRCSVLNRFAYGAHVHCRAGHDTWDADVSPASSFLSSSDPRVHFGLGPSVSTIDELKVRWPHGATDTWTNLPADRIHTIRQKAPRVSAQSRP